MSCLIGGLEEAQGHLQFSFCPSLFFGGLLQRAYVLTALSQSVAWLWAWRQLEHEALNDFCGPQPVTSVPCAQVNPACSGISRSGNKGETGVGIFLLPDLSLFFKLVVPSLLLLSLLLQNSHTARPALFSVQSYKFWDIHAPVKSVGRRVPSPPHPEFSGALCPQLLLLPQNMSAVSAVVPFPHCHIKGILPTGLYCTLFSVASLTQHNTFESHPCYRTCQQFVPFYCWVIFHTIEVSQFIHLLGKGNFFPQFLMIMNTVVTYIYLQIFVWL